ncbi:MAG: helix-turn-helix domain-containing protein [Candidatus Latescibacteria bacterium]|nr:helix-turn-helix domain-containing protein [Candidatus Latescibacterota bacterium]
MKTFRKHLQEELQDEEFSKLYREEKQLAHLSLRLHSAREGLGLSQQEVAQKAKVSQQQLSKLENGANCNITTFLKVCDALGVKVELEMPEDLEVPVG